MTIEETSTLAATLQIVQRGFDASSGKEATLRLAAGLGQWLEAMRYDADVALEELRIVEAFARGEIAQDEALARRAALDADRPVLTAATMAVDQLIRDTLGEDSKTWLDDALNMFGKAIDDSGCIEVSSDREDRLLASVFGALLAAPVADVAAAAE